MGRRRNERGVALMLVVLMTWLITTVTVTSIVLLESDTVGGIRQLQSVKVFNVAEGGANYAIAKMQQAAAEQYPGEATAIDVTDGLTGGVVGSSSVTVRCMNGQDPAVANCAGNGRLIGFRRIIASATLPNSGAGRTIRTVVEAATQPLMQYTLCGYEEIILHKKVVVWGDVGSDGDITLSGGVDSAKICDSSPLTVACGTPPTAGGSYNGGATAAGDISCPSACSSVIEGTALENQPGPICPVVTLTAPSPPGTTPLTVAAGTTVTIDPLINYGAVTLATSSCGADQTTWTTLIIPASLTDEENIVTVRMRTLRMGRCTRLVVSGVGKVELWLLEPAAASPSSARQALKVDQKSIFGSTQLGATPEYIEGYRFVVYVLSNKPSGDSGGCLDGGGACPAVEFDQAGAIAGALVVPAGDVELDQASSSHGSVLAQSIDIDRGSGVSADAAVDFLGDPYGRFKRLKSWKDQ